MLYEIVSLGKASGSVRSRREQPVPLDDITNIGAGCSGSGPLLAEPLHPQPIRHQTVVFFFNLVTKTTRDVSALPVGWAGRKIVMEARRRGLARGAWEDGWCLRETVLQGGRGTWVTLQSTEHVGGTKERNETHLPLTLRALGWGARAFLELKCCVDGRTVRKSCTQSLFVSDVGHPCQRNDVGVKRLPFFNPTMPPHISSLG